MVAIRNVLLLASVASAFILPRDFPTVFNDIKKVDSDVKALNTVVKAYKSGGNLTPILNAEQTLESDIKKATSDAKSSAVVTSAQATQVINYIKGTLIPDIKTCLGSVVAKKGAFTSGGAAPVVKSDLNTLKSLSASLSTALINKTPAAQKAAASSESSAIQSLFASAIKVYNS